jgi:hypothetical protein
MTFVSNPPSQRNLANFTFTSSTVIARLATPTPLAPHVFSIAPYDRTIPSLRRRATSRPTPSLKGRGV